MKKTILLTVALAATVAFAACDNKKKNEEGQGAASEMMEIQEAIEVAEWVGTYEGTIAQADGAGFVSTLELKDDNTFAFTQTANGGEGTAETLEGTYAVDAESNIVTLTAADGMVQKFHYEGTSVVLVDSEGNMPETPDMYRLVKKAI